MALRFDNAADYLERTTAAPSKTAFTMMGWFLISVDRNDFSTFLRFKESGSGSNYIAQTDADGVTLTVYNSSTVDAGSALTVGTWYHIAMVGDNDNVTVYLNGVLDCQVVDNPGLTLAHIQIGNASEFSEFLNGRAAAIKIFDAVLTASEILLESLQYVPVRFADINAWYPVIDNAAADADADYSGNGRDFTVNGSLAIEDGPPIPWRVEQQGVVAYIAGAPPPPGGYVLLEIGDRIILEDGSGFLILEETEEALTISPSGIASAEAFGSHTVSPGAVTISPSAIASEEAFGSATLTATFTITANGIASEEAFGSHTLTTGNVNVLPSSIASAEAFGSHTVTVSALTLSPEGITSAETFGSHTLTTGAVSVSPSGIASAEAFGSHTLAATYTITGSGIASAEAFGSHAVNLMLAILSPAGIASLEAFGLAVVTGGGIPKALAIDDRTFSASPIDSRSILAGWIDSRSIVTSGIDSRTIPTGGVDSRTIASGWVDDRTIDLK